MKRSLLIAAALLSIVIHLKAQDLNGFNFRAQVFDENNKLLLSEKIELDISLLSESVEYYHEKQDLTTDEAGFFNVTIGNGIPIGGSFTTIPWHRENISLKLSYKKENGNDYFSLGSPRLYSVPYAFYAKTAGSITKDLKADALGVKNQTAATSDTSTEKTGETDEGIASKSDKWSMYGNRLASMRQGFIGTTDSSPLVLKSAGVTRAEFGTDGNFQLTSNLVIDSAYSAKIANMETNSLIVSGNDSEMQKLHIKGRDESSSPETGALVVDGGVGINNTLHVKEDIITDRNIKSKDIEFDNGVVRGNLTIDKLVKLNNTTESDNEQTGSLITAGGVGIAKNLNVGQTILTENLQVDGTARFNIVANSNLVVDNNITTRSLKVNEESDLNKLAVSGPATLKKDVILSDDDRSTVVINGKTLFNAVNSVKNTTESANPTEGALTISGGVGIAKNLNVGQKITTLDFQSDGNSKFNNVIHSNLNVDNLITARMLQVNEGTTLKTLEVQDKSALKNDVIIGDVNQNANLIVNGNSIINGISTVANNAESTQTNEGALIVAGGVGIARNLNVGQKVKATNLQVDGTSQYNGDITINNADLTSNKLITTKSLAVTDEGTIKTLNVTGASNFQNDVTIGGNTNSNITVNGKTDITGIAKISDATQSSTSTDGALTVAGGVGIAKNLNVGQKIKTNDLQVDGTSQFNGDIIINNADLTIDKSVTTKSLTVTDEGAIKTLNVTGVSNFQNDVTIGGNTNSNITVNGKTNITGITKISDATQSTTPADGALTVTGGLGVAKNLNVGQKIKTLDFQSDGNGIFNKLNSMNLAVADSATIKSLSITESADLKTLNISGKTTFKNDVDFGNVATNTKSNLLVNGDINLYGGVTSPLKINNTADVTSRNYTQDNGSINVQGGARIAKNLNVAGKLAVQDELYAKVIEADQFKEVNITSTNNVVTTDNSNDRTGALNVAGGAKVNLNMIVGGNLRVEGKINATNGFGVASNLTIDPYTRFAAAASGTAKYAGAINDNMRTADKDRFALYINAINHGIAIKVNRNETKSFTDADMGPARALDKDAIPSKSNDFMSFVDKSDNIIGSIEGQTPEDMRGSLTYRQLEQNISETELRRGFEITLASLKGIMASLKLSRASKIGTKVAFDAVSAADQATPKGLAAPNLITAGQLTLRASLISTFDALTLASEITNIFSEATNLSLKANSLAKSKRWYNEKKADMEKNVGIKYTSRSADYAEWLPLQNTTENIVHGDVVAVTGGKIIKNYAGQTVEKFMVASTAPAIAGAVPQDKTNYREVAFIGQVPVNIIGDIHIGDYVLPSGNGDGLAIAKNKSAMSVGEYKQVIGVAWSDKDYLGKANVAVGINQNDMADVISNLDARLSSIEKMINDNQEDNKIKSDSALAAMKKIQEDNQPAVDSANAALNTAQQSLLDLQKQLEDMKNEDPGDDNPGGSPSDPSGGSANGTNPVEDNAIDFTGMIYSRLKFDKNFKEMIDAYMNDSDNDVVKSFPKAKVGKDLYVKEFVESDFIRPIRESLSNETTSDYTAEERDGFLNLYSRTLQKYFLEYQN